MNITRENLLPGVYLTHIGTDKFKIASLSISFLAQLRRETAPGNALIPNVLCRGSTGATNCTARPFPRWYGASERSRRWASPPAFRNRYSCPAEKT